VNSVRLSTHQLLLCYGPHEEEYEKMRESKNADYVKLVANATMKQS